MTQPERGTEWSPIEGIVEDFGDPDRAEPGPRVRGRRGNGRTRRAFHRVGLLAVLLLVVGLGGAAWVGADAIRAKGELESAASQVQTLQDQVVAGDRAAATITLTTLQKHSAAARAETHGPHWSVAALVPWVRPNIRAVQAVSDVIDDLALRALPALMDATSLVDLATLAPVNGRVDLAPLITAAPPVVAADTAVQGAVKRLDSIDTGALVAQVAAPLANLDAQVRKVAATTATASRAVQLLPPMLGAHGPRDYLLLVQNNAEQRATGGIPGSVLLLRAANGAVEVLEERSGGSLGDLPGPVLPLTLEEQAIFGDGLGADMRDVTFTPDFPRSGQLARAIWNQQVGGEVDGVMSIDPGALAHVLGATGPVTLPTGQKLTADNAVQLLLNTVYLQITDPKEQDAFFATTANSVFDAMVRGQGKPSATVDALARSAREGRLMVWSAHQDEELLLSGTVLSGELVGVQGDSPVVGVYLNDGSASKMGYYLRTGVAVTSTRCQPDGAQNLTVEVTLTSTAPTDAGDLPPYLTGGGREIPAGEIRTNVLLYAPTGGRVGNVRVKTGQQGVFAQFHNGLVVAGKTILLKPGETSVIDYDILTGSGQRGEPVVRVTPGTASSSAADKGPRCA